MSGAPRAYARASRGRVFAAPLAIGVASFAGLVLALAVDDGAVRALSCLMIGVPVPVCLWGLLTARR